MKKLLSILLCCILFFATACGDNENNPNSKDKNSKTQEYFNIFSTGIYHMKVKMIAGEIYMTMDIYVNGDSSATIFEPSAQASKVIVRENKSYIIVDATKMIMVADVTEETETGVVNTDGMKKIASGNAEFNGKTLAYDEYEDGEGNKMQLFIDGSNLTGIRTITAEVTSDMIIVELNKSVPKNIFDIPSGYQQIQS